MLETKANEALDNLESFIDENNMELEVNKNKFPIRVVIRNKPSNQLSVLGEKHNINGFIEFVFLDEIVLNIKDFKIADDLLNKIKNKLKKWHYAYLELYFENTIPVREAI